MEKQDTKQNSNRVFGVA